MKEGLELDINRAIDTLKEGGTVLHPTDTVWGLGCDPYDNDAVQKVFQLKQRPQNMPLLLVVPTQDHLESIVGKVHPKIDKLLYYSNRPVSIIFSVGNNKDFANGIVTNEMTICIRVVKRGVIHKLLLAYGKPMVSTSANIHGHPPTAIFDELDKGIVDRVDFTFHHGSEAMSGKPSTIVRLDDKQKEFEFIRS